MDSSDINGLSVLLQSAASKSNLPICLGICLDGEKIPFDIFECLQGVNTVIDIIYFSVHE